MNKKQFKKMNKACKDAWMEIAEKDLHQKPKYLSAFTDYCPACSIARLANREAGGPQCNFCPADRWREGIRCFGNLYGEWVDILRIGCLDEMRRCLATQIAKLKWTYLPIYKKIPKENIDKILCQYEELRKLTTGG